MVLCPPFPNKEQDTGPIILVIIILQKIRYTAEIQKIDIRIIPISKRLINYALDDKGDENCALYVSPT